MGPARAGPVHASSAEFSYGAGQRTVMLLPELT
jgi:hypothetical protein